MAKSGTLVVKVLGDAKPFEKTMGKVGKVAAIGFAAVGTAAAGVAAGLFKVGESFDKQFDKIRVGTGATGEALDGLQGSFKNVLKSVPASFDDAGSAIADLNTRLGLTGKPLEDLAGQFINLSRITETDLATNVDNITRVFGDWGVAVEDQAGAMDALYRAAQSSGIGIDELSTSVVQFGAPLRNLGFGFDESLALLAQFNKTGVNTETVFAGLKAGVGKLAKAGEDVPTTFRRVVDEITKMGPGSEATGKAIELFGQRAGPDLADAIAGGKFEIDGMLDAITGGSDTINGAAKDTEDFSEKWLMFKNRVLVGLQPIAAKVFDAIGVGMDKISKFAEDAMPAIRQVFDILFKGDFKGGPFSEDSKVVDVFFDIREAAERLARFVTGTLVPALVDLGRTVYDKVIQPLVRLGRWVAENRPVLTGVATAIGVGLVAAFTSWAVSAGAAALATAAALAPIIAVGAAIAAVVAAVVWAYQEWDTFRNTVDTVAGFLKDTVWPIIQAGISLLTDKVIPAIGAVIKWYWNFYRAVFDVVVKVVSKLDDIVRFVISIPGKIAGAASIMWNGIKDGVSAAVKWVGDRIGDIIGAVGRLPGQISSAASGMWDGIKNAFKGAINWIIRKWNGLSFSLPSVDIPGIGKIGGGTLRTPNIPELAKGGVVSRPTLAMVGDAGIGNPEIVAPEKMLRRIMQDVIGVGGPQVIQLVVDGRVLAQTVNDHNADRARRNGAR